MDPISAAATIISAGCAIVGAIDSAHELYARHKSQKAARMSRLKIAVPGDSTPSGAFELTQLLNTLVSKFGKNFGDKLDEQVKSQFFVLRHQLKPLLSEIEALEHDSTAGKSTESIEVSRKALLDRANQLKVEMEGALTQFTNRITLRIALPVEAKEVTDHSGAEPLKFCYGAILCQSGDADSRKLCVENLSDSPKQWGFVCTYCSLEVGDYSAVRFSSSGKPLMYSDMLAASHVMACSSFTDRRAYYKCLACYEIHKNVDLPSASAFEKHMETHPGYSFIKNEPQVSESTRKQIKRYIIAPEPKTQDSALQDETFFDAWNEPVASTDSAKLPDISPISSPELHAQKAVVTAAIKLHYLPTPQVPSMNTSSSSSSPRNELPSGNYNGQIAELDSQILPNVSEEPVEMSADSIPGMPSYYGSSPRMMP